MKQVGSHLASFLYFPRLALTRAEPARSSVLRVSELHHVVWQYRQYHHCMPPALRSQHEPACAKGSHYVNQQRGVWLVIA